MSRLQKQPRGRLATVTGHHCSEQRSIPPHRPIDRRWPKTTSGSERVVVVDTSIVLAVLFAEPQAAWAVEQLTKHGGALRMSTVNLAEALILLRHRHPQHADALEPRLLEMDIRFVPPDVAQARISAVARHRFPLNLGDCFCYALAVVEDCPILTLDRDLRAVDRTVVLPP